MLSKILGIFLLLLFTYNVYTQDSLITRASKYNYLVGKSNLPADWDGVGFDDSEWLTNSGRIGYGQSDVSVTIPKATTVYIRYKFTIESNNNIKALCLMADYNDGFVAYLNGHEVVRENLGKMGESISYNRVADRSHKAYEYRNYFHPLNNYYIDDSTIMSNLVNGENILAIEVHNDSVDGSDLSFVCSLADKTNSIFSVFFDRYLRQQNLDSTSLPIFIVNTDGYGIPTDNMTYSANLKVITNSTGHYNKVSDTIYEYNGPISIKLHGTSSKYYFAKKSFAIETVDSLGNNNNVSLLGLPEDNDWILVSQFTDKSFIRNDLGYYIGRKQGHYEPRSKYFELILNNTFLGLYSLTEKIKRGPNRVDISKLKATDIHGDDLTGGYIGKFDGDSLVFNVYPSQSDIQPEQKEYFNSKIASYFSTLDSSYYSDPVIGYQRFIDKQSLIDYTIAQEIMYNADAYNRSTYLYKDKDSKNEKIIFGPLWDCDIAFGNFDYCIIEYNWRFEIGSVALGLRKVMRDTAFVHQFQKSYFEQRKGFLNIDSLNRFIDSVANYTLEARIRNFQVWPTINSLLFYSCTEVDSIAEAIDYLKTWINNRLIWMDENIGNIYFPENTNIVSITENNNDILVFPNPFNDEITIEFEKSFNELLNIEVSNLLGEVVFFKESSSKNSITISELSGLPSGVYILSFQSKKLGMKNCRIIKK